MDLNNDRPNDGAPVESSLSPDLSGIDLILQASKQIESKEKASRSNAPVPESGIDLLIKASEVLKSEVIVTTTTSGISSLLHAADMLESYPADTLRAFHSGPRGPPFCSARTDASSSASVDFDDHPVDVAISWLERHLTNIERDSKTSWLQDHSYIRPRPLYAVKASEASVFRHSTRPVQVVLPTRRQDDNIPAPSPAKKICTESTGSSSRHYSGTIRRLLSRREVNDETVSADNGSAASNTRPVAVVKPIHYVPI